MAGSASPPLLTTSSPNQNVQSFPVQLDMKALGCFIEQDLLYSLKSNWGGENIGYTCLYREFACMGRWQYEGR